MKTFGTEVKIAQVRALVTVLDVNDNAPHFTREPYYAVVNINAERGTVISKVMRVASYYYKKAL